MKKIMVLYICFLICVGYLASSAFEAYARKTAKIPARLISNGVLYNNNDTSSATFAAIDVSAGQTARILSVGISVETADTITFKCGTTVKRGPIYFGDNSGYESPVRVDFTCADGEDFNITKGTAGTKVTAFGEYTVE